MAIGHMVAGMELWEMLSVRRLLQKVEMFM